MTPALSLALAGLIGYLVGSIPMGVLLAGLFGWPDPRHHGSGHIGALNVSRGATPWAGVLVLLLDLIKGLAAVWLAGLIGPSPWAMVPAGLGAVAGHCWPIWLGFRGGMGLATGLGAVIRFAPLAALIAVLLLAGLRLLVITHTPRAAVVALLLVVPAAALLPLPPAAFWLAAGVATLIALRHLSDWNRVYT